MSLVYVWGVVVIIERQRALATAIVEGMQIEAHRLRALRSRPTDAQAYDCVLSTIAEFFTPKVRVKPDDKQDAELARWLGLYYPAVLKNLRAVLETEADGDRAHWSLVDFCDLHHTKLYAKWCEWEVEDA